MKKRIRRSDWSRNHEFDSIREIPTFNERKGVGLMILVGFIVTVVWAVSKVFKEANLL